MLATGALPLTTSALLPGGRPCGATLITLFEREAERVSAIDHATGDRRRLFTDVECGEHPLAILDARILERKVRIFRIEGSP